MNFKKIILISLLTACLTGITNAQFHFGLKGGVNFDRFNYKAQDLKLSNSTGWQAGVLMQFKVPLVGIGIQPELLYTVKKTDISGESNKINYFEVPLNVRWSFNLLLMRPYLSAGPYFSYATNFKGNTFKEKVERFDWGIGVGGGIEIWKLQIGLRYGWGLQNIGSDGLELKNKMFTVSLGYFLL
jgi:hypothetical protein